MFTNVVYQRNPKVHKDNMKMKRDQFRRLVKEIIMEVVSEVEVPPKPTDDLPVEEPNVEKPGVEGDEEDTGIDMSDVPPPTRETELRWRLINNRLQMLKKDPKFVDALEKLMQSQNLRGHGEAPPTRDDMKISQHKVGMAI